jgi:ferric-dicitrate binding protein FerR (iron transport regulator)
MNKKNTHIDWRIFRKAASHQLTSDEQLLLDEWLAVHTDNQKYFEKAVRYYQNQDEEKEWDYKPAFNDFVKSTQKKKRNYFRFAQIAASVIILLACGWLFQVVINTEDYQALSEAQPIQAKEGEVELVLSTGKKVLLKKDGDHQIKEKQGKIQKKGGAVDYLAFEKKKQKYLQYNTINVPRGTDFKLVLSDSTVVWLNAESTITYPIQFADNIREVSITGEAYFDVTPNKEKPFVVEANGTKVKVLGTEFNVNAYRKDEGIFTTLIEGSVAVGNEFGKSVVIKPNEQAITGSSADVVVKEVDVNPILGWRNGLFDFEDEPLGNILEELARWYDFKIFYEDEDLRNYEFTGGINKYEDVNQLLKLFELTQSVKFYVKKDVLLVKKVE